jgi:hypothetical protein
MIELLRRSALVGGIGWGIWLAAWSPEALFRVEAIDFEQQYAAEYGPRKGRVVPGAMGAAREFLRRNTNPGTVDGYRERKLEHRLVTPATDAGAWFDETSRAGGRWVTADDPHIAAHFDQIKAIRAVWLVSYVPSGRSPNHYVEVRWETDPKDSKAPRALVFPYRHQGFAWMAAGVLLYLLLRGKAPRREEAHPDPLMLSVLDGVAIVFFAIIFYFPLYLADSAVGAREEFTGGTGFFWAIAALFVLRLLLNAAAAARRVRVTDGMLEVQSLFGVRRMPLESLRRVEPLVRKKEQVGLRLTPASGAALELDWSQLFNVEPVRTALAPGQARAARFAG